MGRPYEDLTGQKFGRLTAMERIQGNQRSLWMCKCECGGTKIVSLGNLKSGAVRSCGCLARETTRDRSFKHGETKTRLWWIWCGMRQRCEKVNNKDYSRYGGRGITVCNEWHEYASFRDWAMSNGYSADLTIDRIDNDGCYCPDNCRWVSALAQDNNRRNNHTMTYNGETHTISEWGRITGISPKTILYRINAGWPIDSITTKPVDYRNRLVKHSSAQFTA